MEFAQPEELRRWLEEQTREVIVTMGARSALRMVPFLAGVTHTIRLGSSQHEIIPSVFLANTVAWVAAHFPERQRELREIAGIARDAARSAAHAATLFAPGTAAAAANSAAEAVRAAARTTSRATTIAADVLRALDGTAGVVADARLIDGGITLRERTELSSKLAGAPLWLVDMPEQMERNWAELKRALIRVEEGWEVWIDWYEDRLSGRPANPQIEFSRAVLALKFLKEPPGVVNREIRENADGWDAISRPLNVPIPVQSAGPHFGLSPMHRIGLATSVFDAAGNDLNRLRQLLPLVRDAADDLAGHLNPNASPELSRNLAAYRMAIEGEPETIAWGMAFARGIRLENAAAAARRQIEDRFQPPLEDAAQEALQSLLTLHGPMILATADGRELMSDADRMSLTREQQDALREDALSVAIALNNDREIIEPPAAEAVMEAVETIGEGPHPQRGSTIGQAAIRNVTIWAVGIGAIAAIAGVGFVQAGVALVAIEGLKKSKRFAALTDALGARIDGVLRTGEAFQNFVVRNEEPLRQMASSSEGMRWMLPYIDEVVKRKTGKSPSREN